MKVSPRFFVEVIPTPIGRMTVVVGTNGFVTQLWTEDRGQEFTSRDGYESDPDMTLSVRTQILEYTHGDRTDFALDLNPAGTPFQRLVWGQLVKIPYGTTWSYGQLAASISRPKACRAVGSANGSNPISIIIPCHRVIGGNGSLTGYGGGLSMKRRLLQLEGCLPQNLFDGEI